MKQEDRSDPETFQDHSDVMKQQDEKASSRPHIISGFIVRL